jgi:hypothetical protein
LPVEVGLFLLRRPFRLFPRSNAVEKLADQAKRINLIVVFAGGGMMANDRRPRGPACGRIA